MTSNPQATQKTDAHRCIECSNGITPRRVIRAGRARWLCRECGRDCSLALMMIAEAMAIANCRGMSLLKGASPSEWPI